MALFHRLGARMGFAADDRHFIGLFALNAGDGTDHRAALFHDIGLLDMRLDIGMDREADRPRHQFRKSTMDGGERFPDAAAFCIAHGHDIFQCTLSGKQFRTHHARRKPATFLVHPGATTMDRSGFNPVSAIAVAASSAASVPNAPSKGRPSADCRYASRRRRALGGEKNRQG